jgi:tRNA-splicing ligase RtcB (3'-phosphate/5'-hydroxy nucleic acid ligase)
MIKINNAVIFTDNVEYEAIDQIKKLTTFEAYTDSKIRVMPDVHAGKGCTVGTTMTIADKLTPNLVGVDLNCGILTVRLKDKSVDLEALDKIIQEYVPSGFNIHTKSKKRVDFRGLRCVKHVDTKRAILSVGSLGGGNHFIELAKSEGTGKLHLVIHSGSRKLGGDICKYYQDLAFKKVNTMAGVKAELVRTLKAAGRERDIEEELKKVKKPSANKDLAYLEGPDLEDYLADMKYAQGYASLNRSTIAEIIISKLGLSEEMRYETVHNYIDFKRMILRKGAVSAEEGELFIVPINMRDGSLVCVGKGNPEWNYSAPHGAGRLMSRTKAKETLSMDTFINDMGGIYSTSVCESTLDESPEAYKNLDEIKNAITDTADVVDILKPIYNYKAH